MKKIFNYSLFEKAMHRNGLNAFDFSKKAKIQSGTVSNWKNVKDIKKIAFRESIERILGVKYEDLCVPEPHDGMRVIYSTDLKPATREETTLWPIVGEASGGPWIQAIETTEYTNYAETYMTVSAGIKDENGYALTVVGNSMEPVLPHGTLVAVSPNREVVNGDVAVVDKELLKGIDFNALNANDMGVIIGF